MQDASLYIVGVPFNQATILMTINTEILNTKYTEMGYQQKLVIAMKGLIGGCWFLLIRQICIEWRNASKAAIIKMQHQAISPQINATHINGEEDASSKTQWDPTGYNLLIVAASFSWKPRFFTWRLDLDA